MKVKEISYARGLKQTVKIGDHYHTKESRFVKTVTLEDGDDIAIVKQELIAEVEATTKEQMSK